MLAITHPELFAFEEKYVAVEVNGQHTRGMTLVDERGVGSEFEPNCRVAYNVNAQEAVALIMQAVAEV